MPAQRVFVGVLAVLMAGAVVAQTTPPDKNAGNPSVTSASASGSAASAAPPPPPSAPMALVRERKWAKAPRVFGHLTSKDLGLVINDDDPYSVQVGAYYAKARQIPASQVLHVSLPIRSTLTPPEFTALAKRIDAFYGQRVQGLALAWRIPYGVDCNSITGALAMGFDAKLCSNSCATTKISSYFGSASTKPFQDHRMRLSMMLAAKDVDSAKTLIDRGVGSDHTLGLRGALPVNAHFVTTTDAVRSQRQVFFPPAGPVGRFGLNVVLDQSEGPKNVDRVLMYLTGRTTVDGLDTVNFVPGALADHLTSFGGVLDQPHGQMTVLSWLDAGATASYGTTSEPCAHLQKFPNPQALLLFYVQGATALEAYWKSVAWPQQGLFVGEPLAAPFSR